MKRIFVSAAGLCDWKAGLAQPKLHWERKHSAFELAVTWEATAKYARGLPPLVAALLDQDTSFHDAFLLLAVPEHKVALEGLGKASQTDVWALLKISSGLVSMAVEGKAGETFDKTIGVWLEEAANPPAVLNRQTRLYGLCDTLLLDKKNVADLRYQLLHRAASAVLEAHRFGAKEAILLVQSFSSASVGTVDAGFNDFRLFAQRLGISDIAPDHLSSVTLGNLRLSLGWLNCPFVTDAQIAQAAV